MVNNTTTCTRRWRWEVEMVWTRLGGGGTPRGWVEQAWNSKLLLHIYKTCKLNYISKTTWKIYNYVLMAPFSNSAGASDTCFHRPGSTHNMNTLDRSLRCGHSNTIMESHRDLREYRRSHEGPDSCHNKTPKKKTSPTNDFLYLSSPR